MKRQQRNLLIIISAIIIALVLYQRQQPPPPPPEAPPSPVMSVAPPVETQSALFARKKIERNTKFDNPLKISEYMDLKRDIPKDKLPHDRVATSFSDMKDLIALEDIEKNEPILLTRFARAEEIGGVSHHLPEGMRAITLKVDKVRGVGGFISQGDLVDIIGSFTVDGRNLTKYVLPKVKILAVNQVYVAAVTNRGEDPNASPSPGAPAPAPSAAPAPNSGAPAPGASPQSAANRDRITGQDVQLVTFEVTPAHAERLIVAAEQARLYLVLRNPQDPESPHVDPVDAVDVYVERPKKPPVPKYDIDMLKGALRSNVGVRVESIESVEHVTGVQRYLDATDPNVRDLSEKDLRAIR